MENLRTYREFRELNDFDVDRRWVSYEPMDCGVVSKYWRLMELMSSRKGHPADDKSEQTVIG